MEIAKVAWRKSSHSTNNGGDCVELTSTPSTVAVRDSKNPDGPELLVTRKAFAALLSELKR
ncbi:DUF397 domain-containing protein [Actinomadura madurae]|uniref:DUF397 domain-containing protein n=1 Tax=Actinomadura madurae TaxID=1993 RepID=A0A1I5TAU8_9ACTN|nr:DUF397 domain-containing protein [Actinomadura madurae]MCP9952994.1 DUF397 domain-containing protein [Actinomadura madurae]MCP9969759.1 DUF397 domain-containing protein [Actinomadura madurae]MCP9982211.1 DUF397 domain-containing protein [Actinomadura madurae]MCQ0006262.1 DUF397 domain-containing protein [Actinomadura madurae]MCQ0018459.1 DUF397 domain-containing protein [Actinomadura madurae]